jgi:chromatin segregation and condensation protein Rec8/ScpA/Scc1 (kleisin family)
MMVVMVLLEQNESVEFMQIFRAAGEGDARPTRSVLVATFLAVLELARLSALRIYQGLSERGTPEGAIRVRRATLTTDEPQWRDRITDTM